MAMKNPVHPGAIVREDCLQPLGLSVTEGPRRLGTGRQTRSNPVNERAFHSIGMAYRGTDACLEAAELVEDQKGPWFRSCVVGRQDQLEDQGMSRATALRMIKRRARQAGLPAETSAQLPRDGNNSVSAKRRRPRSGGAVRRARVDTHYAALQRNPGGDFAR